LAWIVRQAKSENKSFNTYIAEIVEEKKEKVERMERLRIPDTISPEVMSLLGIISPFSEEEISSDARLDHILR